MEEKSNSISLFCNEDPEEATQIDPYVPSANIEIRKAKQKDLEDQWKRTGCFAEAGNTYQWDYLKRSNFCLDFYKEGTIDKDLLINPHYAMYLAYWGVWKNCMTRHNLNPQYNQDRVHRFFNNPNIFINKKN